MKLLPVGSRIFQAISLQQHSAPPWQIGSFLQSRNFYGKKDKPGFPKCQCLLFSPKVDSQTVSNCTQTHVMYITIPNNEFIVLRCIYLHLLFFSVIMNMNKEKRKTISSKHSRISEILWLQLTISVIICAFLDELKWCHARRPPSEHPKCRCEEKSTKRNVNTWSLTKCPLHFIDEWWTKTKKTHPSPTSQITQKHPKQSETDMTRLWISLFHIFYIWYLKTKATMPVYYVKL